MSLPQMTLPDLVCAAAALYSCRADVTPLLRCEAFPATDLRTISRRYRALLQVNGVALTRSTIEELCGDRCAALKGYCLTTGLV